MRVAGAILQPSYIPWRGYFHQIQKSDVFVFYDDVQFDKRGWRNRNQLKGPNGLYWLTVPVQARGAQVENTPICEIQIADDAHWARKHWAAIEQSYKKAPFFKDHSELVRSFYDKPPALLADFTIETTIALSRALGLETQFVRSSTLGVEGKKTERLVAVMATQNITHYISGPSAKAYMDLDLLAAKDITLEYMAYEYEPYAQLHGAFEGAVSILDLMFMTGPAAGSHIW